MEFWPMSKTSSTISPRRRSDYTREELLSAMIEYRSSELMEATIAACAIIAHADGEVAPLERARMMQLMRSDALLAMFPRDIVVHEFDLHTRAFDADYGNAVQEALRPILALAGRKQHAEVVMNACLLITAADGRVDPREIDAIGLVRDALNMKPGDESLLTDNAFSSADGLLQAR
jgi:tellurite resistance protein TerB